MLDFIRIVVIIAIVVKLFIMQNNQQALIKGKKKGNPGSRSKFEYKFNGDVERLKNEIKEMMFSIKYRLTQYGEE